MSHTPTDTDTLVAQLTEDDLTALNDGLIGAVYLGAAQIRMDLDHATSLIAMARDSLATRARIAALEAEVASLRQSLSDLRGIIHDQGVSLTEARAGEDELAEAGRRGLNYLENTEGELGILLDSAEDLRAALASHDKRKEGRP